MRLLRIIVVTALASAVLGPASARALSLQTVGGFEHPIYVTSDPGNPNRLFVAERPGQIEEVNGATVTPFANLSSKVECGSASCLGTERGLLSIALAPDFDSSGRLFVDYANGADGTIHVGELRAGLAGAPLSSYREVLAIEHPESSNHNGGQLQFGPEGMLFISTGDGGGGNDEHHNAQNLANGLGKILRIDPDPGATAAYTIPAGNPFAGVPGDYEPIWSYGLRNPFRFSFDKLTGDLVIGDVGEANWEEVDFAAAPGFGAGADYGWNCREGFAAGPATDPGCEAPPPGGFVNPVFAYPHVNPGGGGAYGCAIIGGYVVRDPALGGLYGRYVYADHCTGELRSLNLATGEDRGEGLQLGSPDSFGEDSCGRIYVVSEASGNVYRLLGPQPSCAAEVPPLRPSYIGIRALQRRVPRGRKALITAWVSPCNGRKGESVKLLRGARHLGTHDLDRACTARFRPRITRTAAFRVAIGADALSEAATSRQLKIKPKRRHGQRHQRRR